MKKISFGMWEMTATEVKRMKKGSQILCYDTNYDGFILLHAGIDPIARSNRYKYYSFENPILENRKQEV